MSQSLDTTRQAVAPLRTPPFFWTVCVIVLAIVRAQFGGVSNVPLTLHQSIVDSILAGNDWGRQAFIGNLDSPLLPTLGLLAANLVSKFLGGNPALLLCSISQAILVVCFVKLAIDRRKWILAALIVVVPPAIPLIRNLGLNLDPNWFSAIPAAVAICHLKDWQETGNMRDLLVVAVSSGLLAFAGPGPLVLTIAFLIVLTYQKKEKAGGDWSEHRGLRTLIWMPILYCIALWFLWNSLIFNDMFFGLHELFNRSQATIKHPTMPYDFHAIIALVATYLILAMKTTHRSTARCLLPAVFVIPLTAYFSARLGLGPAGLGPFGVILFITAGTLVYLADSSSKSVMIAVRIAFLIALAIACVHGNVNSTYPIDSREIKHFTTMPISEGQTMDAPSQEELIEFIDKYWPNSRILVCGSRLPALYPDPEEKRFVAKLFFSEEEFIRQAQEEQLHILIPPPDGRFFPTHRSTLADIHENGRDWLFLEKVFPNNWQLWRSTIPPKGESKLLRQNQ